MENAGPGLMGPDSLAKEVVQSEWASWLDSRWRWDWFVTLTHDPTPGRGKTPDGTGGHTAYGWSASEAHWKSWLKAVERQGAPGQTYWFRGREPNRDRYGTHFHALVGGVPDASRKAAWEWWWTRYGMARILPYDPRKGAAHYIAKYVGKSLGDLAFSPNLGHFKMEV